MRFKFKVVDLGDNPVLTLWNDLLEGIPYLVLIAVICMLVLYIVDKYEMGFFGEILEFLCRCMLYCLGSFVISMILSIIVNFILQNVRI